MTAQGTQVVTLDELLTQNDQQWGIVVDVDRCIGCNACNIACHAENNIQIVGEEQAAMGRIMDWIHVDPFFEGEYPDITGEFRPMLCQQCGNAPCESVCPVFASNHTHDGLNAQIYNRCVGTRFCANNCPYHVRVFNFFEPYFPEPLREQLNPDVTVRSSGVMEKCTFCVQRIRKADMDSRVDGEPLQDGELRPACVQSCPTSALIFGDLNDPKSAVSMISESKRAVRILEEKNTKPHVIYLKSEKPSDVF